MNLLTELKVVSPWRIVIPKKTKADKKYSMSLNTFLGLDYTVGNMLKRLYKIGIGPQLKNKKLKTPVEVTIQVYNPSQRRSDKSNFYAMSSKFLYDAMVAYGVIEDDNDNYLKTETILPSICDKNNGLIEFTFKSVDKEP